MLFKTDKISSLRYLFFKLFQIIWYIINTLAIVLSYSIFDEKDQLIRFFSFEKSTLTIVLLLLFAFVATSITMYLIVANKWVYKTGVVEFCNDKILVNNSELNLKRLLKVRLLLNPTVLKPPINRTITEGGGNNWLVIYDRSKKIKIEFFLRSKKEEDEVIRIVNTWQNYTEIEIGKAKESILN